MLCLNNNSEQNKEYCNLVDKQFSWATICFKELLHSNKSVSTAEVLT